MVINRAQSSDSPLGTISDDWFRQAIICDGGVKESFDAVIASLMERQSFVSALKQSLCQDNVLGLDAITILTRDVGCLDNSLKFRLGMLSPDRPAAWFRASLSDSFGPFQSGVLKFPVFANYQESNVTMLKRELRRAWHDRAGADSITSMSAQECLWSRLLAYNHAFENLVTLEHPFADLRLDKLPQSLPSHLHSPMLVAFLSNVASQLNAVRQRLDGCYRELFQASEELWSYQLANQEKYQKDYSASESYKSRANGFRQQAKSRRESSQYAARTVAPRDLQAIKALGFSSMPDYKELRARYLNLVKKHHPDIQGGNEELFKEINAAYLHLASRIQLQSSTDADTRRPR